jgi:hypothetical protein
VRNRPFNLTAIACFALLLCCLPAFGQVAFRADQLKATTAPATTDKIGVSQGTAQRGLTLENLFKVINSLTAKSPPTVADKVVIYDAAGAVTKSAALSEFALTTANQTIAGTKTFSSALVTSAGVGAIVANKATAVEYGDGAIHQTVLTLTLTGANDLDLADGAHGTGVKVYDLPAGRILILGATINASVAHNGAFNASVADTFSFGVGTAVGADDDALTSTEVDLIPSQTLDTASGATTPLAAGAALAASAHFDGTATAKDVYVNVACAAANNSGATTYAVTGTLTLTWINLGDY